MLGSRLGGIAELVTHDVDGILVPSNDTDAWAEAISRFTTDTDLSSRLASGIKPPRTMEHVASDMAQLYEGLLQEGARV